MIFLFIISYYNFRVVHYFRTLYLHVNIHVPFTHSFPSLCNPSVALSNINLYLSVNHTNFQNVGAKEILIIYRKKSFGCGECSFTGVHVYNKDNFTILVTSDCPAYAVPSRIASS